MSEAVANSNTGERLQVQVGALDNYVMPVWHVMRRELGAYFNTAIGYVFLIIFTLAIRYLFIGNLFIDGVAEMRAFFDWFPFLFLFYIPAISMRLWAEERKLGTLELLMTLPIRTWQAVLGKFLAGLMFVGITLFFTFDIPASLYGLRGSGPGPDFGPIIGGYMGAMVLAMVYLSMGAFASSLTGDQIVAFVYAVGLNIVAYFVSFPEFLNLIRELLNPRWAETVQQFGVIHHFNSICRGVVDSRDIIYALSVTGFFLFLNVLIVDRRR